MDDEGLRTYLGHLAAEREARVKRIIAEYKERKLSADQAIDGMLAAHDNESLALKAVADKTAVDATPPDTDNEANKIIDRLLVIPREGPGAFYQKMFETYGQRDPYRDVFRERFGEQHPAYPRLMEMADSIGKENNTWTPSSGNRERKEALRKAFDKIGIKRKY